MKKITEVPFGEFSPDGLEYRIHRPDTARPFDNFIWNKSLIANVQQTGVGYTDYQIGESEMTKLSTGIGRICDFDVFGRDTFLNRLFYIRDNDTGAFWNVGWEPVRHEYESYCCRQGLGYTILENKTCSVSAFLRIFAPVGKDPVELWTLELDGVENRNLSVFVYVQMSFKYMWGFNSYGDMLYRNSFFDARRNMMVSTKHPFVSPHPYQTGFLATDATVAGYDGSKDFFVGLYSQMNEPQAVVEGRCRNSEGSSDSTIMALMLPVESGAGKKRMEFAFGVSDTVPHAAALKNKYLGASDKAFEALRREKQRMIEHNSVKTPDSTFNFLFNAWNKQQARFGAEWCRWGWMGYRDIVQHGMGVSSFLPERTREIILEALRHQYASGLALRGWNPIDTKEYSDSALWLIFTLTGYLRETGDRALLEVKVPFFDEGEADVLGHIDRALDFLERNKGVHELLLIKFGDWNDSLTGIGKGGKGESVWLSMAYSYALVCMSELAEWLGDEDKKQDYLARHEKINAALNHSAWDGNWYVRGFCDDGRPIGSHKDKEGRIYLNTQSWAMICGAADGERQRKMLAAVDRNLDTPLGYQLMAPAYRTFDPVIGRVTSLEPGICENATIYSHCNAWMILGLFRTGRIDLAYELYRKATPAFGDDEYKKMNPRFVYGNCYFGPEHRNRPYQMEFNWITGSIAWFYNILLDELLGIRREYTGLRIAPHIPSEWDGFSMTRIFRGKTVNVSVKGNGSTVVGITLNGKAVDGNFIPEHLLRKNNILLVSCQP